MAKSHRRVHFPKAKEPKASKGGGSGKGKKGRKNGGQVGQGGGYVGRGLRTWAKHRGEMKGKAAKHHAREHEKAEPKKAEKREVEKPEPKKSLAERAGEVVGKVVKEAKKIATSTDEQPRDEQGRFAAK